jgi:hypothetical protein
VTVSVGRPTAKTRFAPDSPTRTRPWRGQTVTRGHRAPRSAGGWAPSRRTAACWRSSSAWWCRGACARGKAP